jgi:hypothetical protein
MSEHNEEQQAASAPSARPGWRERAYGIRGVAAVAVAGLIIGGGAGAAIHAATADEGGWDGRPGFGRHGGPGGFGGPGDFGRPGGPGRSGGPGGQLPGQPPSGRTAPPNGGPQQPATPPEDGVSPGGSDDSTSGDTT